MIIPRIWLELWYFVEAWIVFYVLRPVRKFVLQSIPEVWRCFVPDCFQDEQAIFNPKWFKRAVLQPAFPDENVPMPSRICMSDKQLFGGGMVGQVFKIDIEYPANLAQTTPSYPKHMVVKRVCPQFMSYLASVYLHNAKEAEFYRVFAVHRKEAEFQLGNCIPHIYYTARSFPGEYLILMEDLSDSAVLGGHILGNQCWGPAQVPPSLLNVSAFDVFENIFCRTAVIHAHFWRNRSLLKLSWLKGVNFLQGKDRSRWELAMGNMRLRWKRIQQNSQIRYSPVVETSINRLLANTSWEVFQQNFDINAPDTPFTLCHGDYHAGNVLWPLNNEPDNMKLVDWAEVGVFCPFTELAQFLVSHASIDLRRQSEVEFLRVYHTRLLKDGVSEVTFPFSACWERYKAGGIERWLQMLLLLTSIHLRNPAGLPKFGLVWFHNQVQAFIEDHLESCERPLSFMTPYCMPVCY